MLCLKRSIKPLSPIQCNSWFPEGLGQVKGKVNPQQLFGQSMFMNHLPAAAMNSQQLQLHAPAKAARFIQSNLVPFALMQNTYQNMIGFMNAFNGQQ